MPDPSQTLKPMLIDGQWVAQENGAFDSVNPATGARNFRISGATQAEIDAAVDAGWRAVRQAAWRDMLPHARAALLRRMADGIDASAELLARLQMIENGKVWNECKAQVASAAATFRYYAGVCETLGAEVTPSRGNYLSMTRYEPYGVVLAITPWNSPLTMEAQKVAPALAAGNAVILKPSEVTSSPALELGRIALEAGVPPGILNVVTGLGSRIGNPLVQHPGVRMVSFTGGTATGRVIAHAAADKLMPVALELGGKSPHIVFADADLDAAIDGVIGGIFEGSGQSCVAGSRLCVQRGIAESFIARLAERAGRLRVDLPDAERAQMGPIASFDHRGKIEGMVDAARAKAPRSCWADSARTRRSCGTARSTCRPSCPAWRATRPWCARRFRARAVRAGLRGRGRPDRPGQRQRLRPGLRRLDRRLPPRLAGGPAAGSRQRMDQHLQAAVDRHAVRRL